MNDDPTLPLEVGDLSASPASSVPSTNTPNAPRSWGPFKLLARVGHGSFGEVYRAWDPHLEREVALKLLLPTSVAEGQADREYEAMLREARALASVRHTNIVPIYGIDRHDGRVGFWTDFVRGKTLAVLLREQGPFGCREAALIGLDLARALSAVHRAGILHRDIKAENVMREEGGRILLMDFGLSTLPERQVGIAGTPNYMAPELFTGSPASISSDLYALGILLFALVAGEPPARLSGLSSEQTSAAFARRKMLMDLRADLPESFVRAVNTAIELDPTKRFSSAGQLAQALSESLGTSLPGEAARSSGRLSFGRKASLAALTAILLLIVGYKLAAPRLHRWFPPSTLSTPFDSSTDEQYQRAQDLLLRSYKSANTADAIQGFQKILQQDPGYALAHAGLGRAYLIQYGDTRDPKLLDLSRTETNQALRLDPNLSIAYITLARMAASEGLTALAMQDAEKARALDPSNADAYGTLAKVFDAQHRPDDAAAALQKAIDLTPDDWRFHVSLGSHYEAQGKDEEAAVQFQKGVELAPDNAFAYYDLGVVHTQLDRLDEARTDFEKSLKIQPDSDTYFGLGEVFLLQGKYDQAAETTKKAIALSPTDSGAWGFLGEVYLWSGGHPADAAQSFGKAIQLAEAARLKRPKDVDLLSNLANYYAQTSNPTRSLPLIRQALALAPDDPTIAYSAGYTYEVLGDRAAAIPLIVRALSRGLYKSTFAHNPRLAALRNDPSFVAALNSALSGTARKSVDTPKKIS